MSGEADLQGGACQDLAPEVVDKSFFSNGVTDRFEHATAKAICAQCPVQQACLELAIADGYGKSRPGVGGGESPEAIRVWNYRHRHEGTPIRRLAQEAIARQEPLTGRWGNRGLRVGQFVTRGLLHPELGGEA